MWSDFEEVVKRKACKLACLQAFLVRVFITDSMNKLLTAVKHTLFQAIINNRKELQIMKNNILSCEFNIDTACVEVKLTDGSMVSIDCDAVEDEYANNMYEVSELDYLIYNEPISYVKLLLSGKIEEYLRNSTDYTPLSDLR